MNSLQARSNEILGYHHQVGTKKTELKETVFLNSQWCSPVLQNSSSRLRVTVTHGGVFQRL